MKLLKLLNLHAFYTKNWYFTGYWYNLEANFISVLNDFVLGSVLPSKLEYVNDPVPCSAPWVWPFTKLATHKETFRQLHIKHAKMRGRTSPSPSFPRIPRRRRAPRTTFYGRPFRNTSRGHKENFKSRLKWSFSAARTLQNMPLHNFGVYRRVVEFDPGYVWKYVRVGIADVMAEVAVKFAASAGFRWKL